MASVKTISLQFQGQRKPQDYVVYPAGYKSDGSLNFQSDKTCGRVNPTTGECIYNPKAQYFAMLLHPSAIHFTMDQETIDKIKEAQPQSGDTMGGGSGIIA